MAKKASSLELTPEVSEDVFQGLEKTDEEPDDFNLTSDEGIFDNIDNIKLSQDVKKEPKEKVIKTVGVGRPDGQNYIRLHSEHFLDAYMIRYSKGPEFYFVHPSLAEELMDEVRRFRIFFGVTLDGDCFLWPIPHPSDNRWHESALIAALTAKKEWVRIKANTFTSGYDLLKPIEKLPEPQWPENTFSEILKVGFKDRIILDLNHRVVRKLRGTRNVSA